MRVLSSAGHEEADLVHDDRIKAALGGAEGCQVAAGRDERGDHHLGAPQHRAAHLPGRLLHLRRALLRLRPRHKSLTLSTALYEYFEGKVLTWRKADTTQWALVPLKFLPTHTEQAEHVW